MSGESLSAADKLKKWDEVLDDYEKSISVPKIQPPGTEDELNNYLTMNRDHIEKLSHEDCGIIIVRLAQFATYIQRNCNREKARVTWAKMQLRDSIAMEVSGYKGYSYDERAAQAIKNNTYAAAINRIIAFAESRYERLYNLSTSIHNLAEFIKNLQYSKRKNV